MYNTIGPMPLSKLDENEENEEEDLTIEYAGQADGDKEQSIAKHSRDVPGM